ncbi:MAG: SH3 domain-containing protein [Anaeromicrobium sp.]|jgi:hypothetical protein|uniref:putative glycoside hydrolase n=1 Tax=Anaeromicrobium sp. TaxID=1929132 RepID=UPI0025CFC1B1|nr:putative glycoside hydrolase [Anaeromicrobium sp.]MCT4595740.1 SH3 domain-containing protein [Anaeromicrobium sp.]
MKKKIVALCLSLALVVGVVGCTKKDTPVASTDGQVEVVDSKGEEAKETTSKDVKDETSQGKEGTEKESNLVYISASKLRMREAAKADASIVDNLLKGSQVTILESAIDEQNREWYKVSYDGKEGYIAAEYTVKDRRELLSEKLRNLDFSPQKKVESYPSNPKQEVRGVYVTLYSASNKKLDELIEMSKRTKINAFVIDVKDDNGSMLFKTQAAEKYAPDANKRASIKDVAAFMKKLKDNNIYAIARIVSFKDPTYSRTHPDRAIIYKSNNQPFTNRDGLIWASAHDRELWNYNIAVAKEAAKVGFNEIQFDYVRFPASNGGKLDKLLDYRNTKGESKPETIQNYLKFAREQLAPEEVYIGADVYGLVGSVTDDMALGQYWEAVSNIVDTINPMMYPSHYANGTYGLSVPDAFPYETLYYGTKDAINRNKNIETPASIRPWIQDFTAKWVRGHIKYGPKEVEAQVRALDELGIKEYMLWNAANRYSKDGVK